MVDSAVGISLQDELNAVVECIVPNQAVPIIDLKIEGFCQCLQHHFAAIPGSAGGADEGFSMIQGNAVIIRINGQIALVRFLQPRD